MNYDSYRLVPQYSEIRSRADVDTSSEFADLKLSTPIMTSNMDTVTEHKMAEEVHRAGAIGALHRFMSIEENVEQYQKVKKNNAECFISIGVNGESKERFQELYKNSARRFVLDIAHAHSIQAKEMIQWVKKQASDVYLVAGNIGTVQGLIDLYDWGADCCKLNIAPGAACSTYKVTGVMAASVELLKYCSENRDRNFPDKQLIVDGGIRNIGDVCKALVYADVAMIGFLFAQCKESPMPGLYRGMASSEAMKKVKDPTGYMPTPEGTQMFVETKYSAFDLVGQINGGLRSALTYSNSKTLEEFKVKAKLVRVDK